MLKTKGIGWGNKTRLLAFKYAELSGISISSANANYRQLVGYQRGQLGRFQMFQIEKFP